MLARRAGVVSPAFIDGYNRSFYGEIAHLEPGAGYVAPPLDGIWASAPYLHNGSVPTLAALLESRTRPRFWARRSLGSSDYDTARLGWRLPRAARGAGSRALRRRAPPHLRHGSARLLERRPHVRRRARRGRAARAARVLEDAVSERARRAGRPGAQVSAVGPFARARAVALARARWRSRRAPGARVADAPDGALVVELVPRSMRSPAVLIRLTSSATSSTSDAASASGVRRLRSVACSITRVPRTAAPPAPPGRGAEHRVEAPAPDHLAALARRAGRERLGLRPVGVGRGRRRLGRMRDRVVGHLILVHSVDRVGVVLPSVVERLPRRLPEPAPRARSDVRTVAGGVACRVPHACGGVPRVVRAIADEARGVGRGAAERRARTGGGVPGVVRAIADEACDVVPRRGRGPRAAPARAYRARARRVARRVARPVVVELGRVGAQRARVLEVARVALGVRLLAAGASGLRVVRAREVGRVVRVAEVALRRVVRARAAVVVERVRALVRRARRTTRRPRSAARRRAPRRPRPRGSIADRRARRPRRSSRPPASREGASPRGPASRRRRSRARRRCASLATRAAAARSPAAPAPRARRTRARSAPRRRPRRRADRAGSARRRAPPTRARPPRVHRRPLSGAALGRAWPAASARASAASAPHGAPAAPAMASAVHSA